MEDAVNEKAEKVENPEFQAVDRVMVSSIALVGLHHFAQLCHPVGREKTCLREKQVVSEHRQQQRVTRETERSRAASLLLKRCEELRRVAQRVRGCAVEDSDH